MKIFLPKQSEFFGLFKDLDQCFTEITDLFYEFCRNFSDSENFAARAKEIEKKADSITHSIIDHLNKTFITPIDREDIYMLAYEFDDIIDLVEGIMHNINIYGDIEKFDAAIEFSKLFKEAAVHLGDLLQSLQKTKYTETVMNLKIKIHELEDQGDIIFTGAIKKLFKEATDPIKTIKMKDLLEDLENTMDKCQKVSDIIEGIIVKST